MSRIGKMPIELPKGVEVKAESGSITVKGPKGTLLRDIPSVITVAVEGSIIAVTRKNDENQSRALHGLYRMLILNMVTGVSKGFEKKLELSGVGYRASKQGNKLVLQLGYSHPVTFDPPQGIEFKVEGQDKVVVSGADKEMVGRIAGEIRASKEVEPYKGKGIKYFGEIVRRKAGKAAKAAGAGAK